jgi:hypothetical protein
VLGAAERGRASNLFPKSAIGPVTDKLASIKGRERWGINGAPHSELLYETQSCLVYGEFGVPLRLRAWSAKYITDRLSVLLGYQVPDDGAV